MRQPRRTPESAAAPGSDARIELGRHEARRLFELVEDVVERPYARELEALLVDASLDVSLLSRRGRRVEVAVGLPLLESLPAAELRALLAAEAAANAPRHGLAVWRSVAANETAGLVARELESSVVVATALVRRELVRRVLDDDYWPAVFRGAQSSAHPQVKPFTSIRRTLQAHIEAGALRVAAGRLFEVEPETRAGEGAPTLAERLRALGVVPVDAVDAALLPVAVPAAELLGGAYPSVLARLDARWRERVDEWWEEAHREALQQALAGQPTTGHVWAQASALARYREAHERTASGR
jgi:hypothetical protein